jgi:hypothetical protein
MESDSESRVLGSACAQYNNSHRCPFTQRGLGLYGLWYRIWLLRLSLGISIWRGGLGRNDYYAEGNKLNRKARILDSAEKHMHRSNSSSLWEDNVD